ncbi:MAG: pyruvate kinase [Candidatus Woesearchaeota archaeon]
MNYRRKNTKIVATISDLRCEKDFIESLYAHGMDVVRLNTAHQDTEGTKKIIENVRAVSHKIAILLDTKGPEMRTTHIEEPIAVKKDDLVAISGDVSYQKPNTIYINYAQFHNDVPIGTEILINDGELSFLVEQKEEQALLCRVRESGTVKNKKTVNVPGVHINLPSISKKDEDFIQFAIEQNLDFIAHSFVRNKKDVLAVKNILEQKQSPIKVIAKIENREGFENIDEILDIADGIMIARGDLGVEVFASEVPVMQKKMIIACMKRAKPVIVATQMLESMIQNARATRAEVSDVANAILDGAGAVMLSGETVYGDYPVEAVRTMAEISQHLAKFHRKTNPAGVEPDIHNPKMFLAKAAVDAALSLDIDAIVVPSFNGQTARIISAMRSRKPVFAPCYNESVMRQLSLNHGVRAFKMTEFQSTEEMIFGCVDHLVQKKAIELNHTIVIVSGTASSIPHTCNFLEIATVKDILTEYKSHQRS